MRIAGKALRVVRRTELVDAATSIKCHIAVLRRLREHAGSITFRLLYDLLGLGTYRSINPVDRLIHHLLPQHVIARVA